MKLRPRILTFRRRHLLLAVIAIVYIWLATAGTWDLFGPEQFGSFYDYQALAFRHGRLNVPPESIGYEAFLYQGKTYGYWGPFPALLRLPLAIFGRGPWVGHLSRISCLAAALVSLAAVCGLFRELRQRLTPGAPTRDGGWFEDVCLAGLALGTTTLFLIARPYVYHEVILWASALALLALDWGLRYERERKYIWLLAAALAGAGAALTRPTIGYGALLGTTLLWAVSLARDARTSGRGLSSVIASVRSRRHVAFALVILFGLLAPLVYNFLRFDEFSPPYRLHILYTPERLARTNGGHLFQPANFGPTLRAYLNPTQGEWRAQFPYFFTTYFSPEHPGRPVLDYSEPVAGLLATDIGLAVLAVIGVVRLARDPPLLALGAGTLATIYLTSIYACITERYLHDFLPALALTAISGAAVLIHRTGRAARFARGVVTALVVISIAQFFAISLQFQRGVTLPTLDPIRRDYAAFCRRIDSAVQDRLARVFQLPLPRVVVANWNDVPPPRAGLIVEKINPAGMIWYDGRHWQKLSGVCDNIYEQRLQVTLPPDGAARSEPLVSIGNPQAATIVFLNTDGTGAWRVGCDIWGASEILEGDLFRPTSRTMDLTVVLDRINHRVRVLNGDAPLLDVAAQPHDMANLPVHLGENPFGGSFASAKFNGSINPLPARK